MQPKSNVTAHKKPQEQKEREQLTKERKTGTEQQKPKRLSTSAGSLRRSGKKDEERKVSTQNGGHCTYVYNACSKAVCLCVCMCIAIKPNMIMISICLDGRYVNGCVVKVLLDLTYTQLQGTFDYYTI